MVISHKADCPHIIDGQCPGCFGQASPPYAYSGLKIGGVCPGSGFPLVAPVASSIAGDMWCGVCGARNPYGGYVMPTHVQGKPPASPL